MKLEHKLAALEVRASEEEDGIGKIEGYGSVFGVRDSYGDVVAKGAFQETLKSGRKVKMLWQHRADMPIGVWDEMEEDKKGLVARGRINLKTTMGRDAYESVKMGSIEGLSIGFKTVEEDYDEDKNQRTLKSVELWELSLVTFPANPDSNLTSVKAFKDLSEIDDLDRVLAERKLRSLGMSREEAKRFLKQVESFGRADKIQMDLQTLLGHLKS